MTMEAGGIDPEKLRIPAHAAVPIRTAATDLRWAHQRFAFAKPMYKTEEATRSSFFIVKCGALDPIRESILEFGLGLVVQHSEYNFRRGLWRLIHSLKYATAL
jgi:hypothetical protein